MSSAALPSPDRQAISASWATLVSALIGLLALFGATAPALALDPDKAITQYVHSAWGMHEGLSHSGVTRMLQTKDGFLWVGTQAGLARFDGARFTTFDHTNTSVLGDGFITDLFEDSQGTLWVGSLSSGVVQFRNGKFSRVAAIGALDGVRLAGDGHGGLWIGGSDGLKHVEAGVVTMRFGKNNGLAGGSVSQLRLDPSGSLWIGTAGGLYRLSQGKLRAYTQRDGVIEGHVTMLRVNPDGSVWVKTNNAPTVVLRDGRFQPWTAPAIDGANVRDMLWDRNASHWVSSPEGLVRIAGSRVSRFTAKDGLSNDAMTSLYEDRDGNLWAGTNGGGLNRFKDGSFTTYSATEGLSGDPTYAVTGDDRGGVWVSAPSGLSSIDSRGVVQVVPMADNSEPTAMLRNRDSELLVGTSVGGMARMQAGRLVPMLTTVKGMPSYFISALLEDKARHLWMAPRAGGLVRHANGSGVVRIASANAETYAIYALAEGSDGTVWYGTQHGLGSILNGVARTHTAGGLGGAAVVSLFIDRGKTLWIGTIGRGLFRLDDGRIRQYTTHQGLLDDNVNSIIADAENNLWIGSDHGVSRIAREQLDAHAQAGSAALDPTHFGRADGMKSSETMTGTQPSAWRGVDGRLWFPTNKGVVVVDPANLLMDFRPPLTRIEEVFADQVAQDVLAPLSFAPGTRRLEIRFTAPAISSPQSMQFRYRLDGFDPDWVPADKQRLAQYTNLSPGKYTFHVSARVATGPWGSQQTMLAFELQPRFYQTRWFQFLCVLASVLLLWFVYRIRVNWLHARAAVHEERQRIARNIHDSLSQSLSGIIFLTQAALISMKREPEKSEMHMTSARDLAKSGLDEARYSVWDLSAPVLDEKNIVESLQTVARQLARGRVEELNVHSSGTEWTLRPASRHHVLMIAQEAISNAIKHGHAKTVSVTFVYSRNALLLVVADDGVGFEPATAEQQSTHGYGLRNMLHRAGRMGASLQVHSEAGIGTKVSLRIPRVGPLTRLWRRSLGRTAGGIDA